MFFLVAKYLYGPPSIPISFLFGPHMVHHLSIINPLSLSLFSFFLFMYDSLRFHPRCVAAVAAAAAMGWLTIIPYLKLAG